MKIRELIYILTMVLPAILGLQSCSLQRNSPVIDLSGKWNFMVDSLDKGIQEKWFTRDLTETVKLPGSMLTNGKGDDVTIKTKWTGGLWDSLWYKSPEFEKYRQPGNVKVSFWLQPLKHYTGSAWYSKKVTIPKSWKGRYIEMFLERCHWESTVWVDSSKAGMQNALGAPHIYDLSKWLTPGEHLITIRIDNRVKDIDPGRDAHSISDNTQTNWNGIIGKMCLTSHPPVHIDDIMVFTDVDAKKIRTIITIRNSSGIPGKYSLKLSAIPKNSRNKENLPAKELQLTIADSVVVLPEEYEMGSNPLLWDEFNPAVYTLKAELTGESGWDVYLTDFGMKKFEIRGTQFYVNGRPIFLRGTLECAIFPETGYPSVSVEEWKRIYKKCKEFGLNHMRFHSWCPPEAAFIAADEEGIYLSVENSAWANVGSGAPIDQYLYDESKRIVKQFGNHPSFCMMPYGNEASGDSSVAYLTRFVRYWKDRDNRRVYTSASGFPESQASDYTSSATPRIQWWAAGLTSPINAKPPTSDYDWLKYIAKDKPTVSHEIGQWCVYPDFKEISRYKGVLKARNFEIFRDKLQEHGMLQLADSFLLASGKLQVLCYKADIEAALRTPGFAGFQLLDLHDFPGQGTALIGVLNPFWEEKGYVTAAEFSTFCNQTVPLLRMPKMVYLNNETFVAKAEVAHYGSAPLKQTHVSWKISRTDGSLVAEGKPVQRDLSYGINDLGNISVSLTAITAPEKLIISVSAGNYTNSWDFWVYPAQLPPISGSENILVTGEFNQKAVDFLENGGKVLLTVKKGSVKPSMGGDVPVGFSSIFWNTQWTAFKQPPFTLGILCNPNHPAFDYFPTEYHSNWQWWDPVAHSQAMILNDFPSDLKPLIQPIDTWFENRRLALAFEAQVNGGKLLVCSIDLKADIEKRPVTKQLLLSLLKYMNNESFNPESRVEIAKVRGITSDSL